MSAGADVRNQAVRRNTVSAFRMVSFATLRNAHAVIAKIRRKKLRKEWKMTIS